MSWDVIVVGTGGVGSQVLAALAERGVRALGIDRFAPPHDRGSSHGETRIIRLAYMEHPDYVPILRRAYAGWAALEARTGARLYEERGLVQVGPPDGHVVRGVQRAAELHGLDIEVMDARALAQRHPSFSVPEHHRAVFERRAGFLWVERCIEAALSIARAQGAELEVGPSVLGWREEGDGVVVHTDRGPRRAARLVVCPGAWAPELLSSLGVPFVVRRKTLHWFAAPPDPTGPAWLVDTGSGVFYGFPSLEGSGLKAAQHTGGDAVRDPLAVDRDIHATDRAPVEAFLARHRPPYAGAPHLRGAVCMYTMTPDENFVVDLHPASSRVAVVAGLSGHGFKMASALGPIAAELVLDGRSSSPARFLGLARFARG